MIHQQIQPSHHANILTDGKLFPSGPTNVRRRRQTGCRSRVTPDEEEEQTRGWRRRQRRNDRGVARVTVLIC